MSSSRVSMYIPPQTEHALSATGDGDPQKGGNRSQRIASVCSRYMAMVRASTPSLSEAEWGVIVDSLNGCLSLEAGSAALAPLGIIDDPDLGPKWGVDLEQLGGRLVGFSEPQRIAITEVSERFWGRLGREDRGSMRQQLEAAGARIA